ncbi:type II toxin-antitoxin system Phd/YefM family antitoxin [Paenibacillus sp. PsM32]|uniref:Antitoxin n=1 Tax=Paenibacillus kyungheensis TaxID=1452732 RepID=A0AAX3M050_9BACL|nr:MULTISPECIES: type II toxin-antitoxin system Phd/YefM family antitoxin [Paenibacillus]MDN4620908.1 type II toxin-antitoxin system Phd/YefM family antitoxin [Paenibacillus sp. PsM32]WCT55629.1 type II toxin-antitoxin system Phd/YefM family antitoxin [Paenibacillus kyungheensis]
MYKVLNVRTESITKARANFNKVIKEVRETHEPIYILSNNEPSAVILDAQIYQEIVERNQQLESELLYAYASQRVQNGNSSLISADEVVNTDLTDNPYANLSDEELFD